MFVFFVWDAPKHCSLSIGIGVRNRPEEQIKIIVIRPKPQVFEALNYLEYRFSMGTNPFHRVCLFDFLWILEYIIDKKGIQKSTSMLIGVF